MIFHMQFVLALEKFTRADLYQIALQKSCDYHNIKNPIFLAGHDEQPSTILQALVANPTEDLQLVHLFPRVELKSCDEIFK